MNTSNCAKLTKNYNNKYIHNLNITSNINRSDVENTIYHFKK